MSQRQRHFGWLVLAATALLTVACAPVPAPTATPPAPTQTPAPRPTATARATATFAPTATPSPTTAADDLAAWQPFETDAFSIRLPTDWQAIDPASGDAGAVVKAFAEDHPFLAGLAADPESLADVELLAIWPPRVGFVDNLLIHRAALGAERIRDLRDPVDAIRGQLRLLGLEPSDERTDLQTEDGLPMARVVYTLPAGDKGSIAMTSYQYYVLTDTALWVLTYSAPAEGIAAAFASIEESARSFAPR